MIPAKVSDTPALAAARAHYRNWLFDAALPFWWRYGASTRPAGGFHDRLHADGTPEFRPQRLRVQARQVFVYAEAGRLGWSGPWATAVEHGARAMLGAHRRDDGLFRAEVDHDGRPFSDHVDLYDQTFVLLAMAAMWRAGANPPQIRAEAVALLERLRGQLAHPVIGFEEARPRRLPLCSNPHMHLLEAMLAWVAAGEGGLFADTARAIVQLARNHLFDPHSGSIGEYFDGDWQPMPGPEGELREPGHQLEWAVLLNQAETLLGVNAGDMVTRLYAFGVKHRLADGLLAAATDRSGAIIDGSFRLWPQTEGLRAALVLGPRTTDHAEKDALESLRALGRFLPAEHPGWWSDRLTEDGVPIAAAAPASSLYHLMTGLSSLLESPDV